MIAHQVIEVFVKYYGESDAFERVATPEERLMLSADTVRKIEDIILHLSLTGSAKASAAYAAETTQLVGAHNVEPSALRLLTDFIANRQSV